MANRDIQILREVVTKLTPMLAGKGFRVTQRGMQAQVQTDEAGKPVAVNLPHIPDDASEDLILAIQGFLDHEVAHILHTDWSVVLDVMKADRKAGFKPSKAQPQGPRHWCHNIIEDTYIERAMGKTFPGSVHNLERLHRFFIKKLTMPQLEAAKDDVERFKVLLIALMRGMSGQTAFTDWLNEIKAFENPVVGAFIAKLPQTFIDRLPLVENSREALELSNMLHDILFPPKPPQPKKAKPPKAPPPPKSEEKDKDDEPQDDESEPDESEGGGDGEGSEGEQSEDSEAEADPSEDPADESGEEAGDGEPAEGDDEKESKGKPKKSKPKKDKGEDEEQPADPDDADEGDAPKPDEGEEDGPGAEGDEDEPADEGDGEEETEADPEPGEGDEETEGDPEPGEGDEESDGSEDGEGDEGDEDGAEGEEADGSADESEDGEGDEEGDADGESGSDTEEGDGDEESDGEAGGSAGGGEADGELEESEELEGTPSESEPQEGLPPMFTGPLPEDFADALSIEIANEAERAARGADYVIFSKDFDRIEEYKVSARYKDVWLVSLEDQVRSMVGSMQKDIERMMAARSQVINQPGHRSGRLHSAGLHRLTAGDDRVFRRKVVNQSKSTAVGILLDNSGSMRGSKMKLAMESGFALSQTLERVGIQHEVLGFTTTNFMEPADGERFTREEYEELNKINQQIHDESRRIGRGFSRVEPIYMPIYKGFDERLTPAVKKRFVDASHAHSYLMNNIDGESVENAVLRLMKRREERKVLLVLSDGYPVAAGNRAEQYSKLHAAVEFAKKVKVELVGIGIEDAAVKSFYPKFVVLRDLNSLPAAVMGQLKSILLGN